MPHPPALTALGASLFFGTLLSGCAQPAPATLPVASPLVTTFGFTSLDGRESSLRAQGIRIFGKVGGGASSASQDFEPEYVAVSADSSTAWVTLQENNALAMIDLKSGTVSVKALGFKDHSAAGNALDASDLDTRVNIQTWPVKGMYQPDGIAAFSVDGATYTISANEGDARDYTALPEVRRVKDLKLDPVAFPNAAALQADAALGRLNVTNQLGDTDGDGDFDALYSFGARSFSVRDAAGTLVYDSGDLIERTVAAQFPARFNANSTSNTFDNRSDDKGPEPEGVTVGQVGGRTLAFLSLERMGGVMVIDVGTPASPTLLSYVNPRDFTQDVKTPPAGDLAPEGLAFVPAAQSPSGRAMLIVANETSGTTTLYGVADSGTLTPLGRSRAPAPAYDVGAAEIPAYDPASRRVFVVNGGNASLDILDVADPGRPTLVKSVPLQGYGGGANSVAVSGGVVAVAVQNDANRQANGKVVLLDKDGVLLARPIEVGALPDMLVFTPDGQNILVANEGEPSSDYAVDPVGSVSMVNLEAALKVGK